MLNCLLWTSKGNCEVSCIDDSSARRPKRRNESEMCSVWDYRKQWLCNQSCFSYMKKWLLNQCWLFKKQKRTSRSKWAIHAAEYRCTPAGKSEVFTINCLIIQFAPQVYQTICMDDSETEPFAYSWDQQEIYYARVHQTFPKHRAKLYKYPRRSQLG